MNKQAVQAFLIPELDAINAQIAEVRGVQTQMSERLSEQAAQVLEISRRIDAQRQELQESMREMETRLELESRMESGLERMESRIVRMTNWTRFLCYWPHIPELPGDDTQEAAAVPSVSDIGSETDGWRRSA